MLKEFIKYSLKEIKRNKKNKILIIIFSLLFFLLFIDIIIIKNFYDYYDYAINTNIGFRTLNVYYNSNTKKEAIAELESIEHVSEVYEGIYKETAVQTDITDNGSNGWIGFIYGSKNTAPISIKGKNIDELLPGEIICPYEFYPDSNYDNPLNIDESKFLSEKETLNRNIIVKYNSYKSNIVNGKLIEDQEEQVKNMKIVGLYDESIFKNGINVCYATFTDIKDIVDAYNPPIEDSSYYPLHIVVDEEKNVKEVYKNIQRLKKYEINEETIACLDKGFVSVLFSVTLIFAMTIIISFLIILKNYITKKIKSESKNLGILRACGYTENQVIIKEVLENSIVQLISFIISASLFSTLFLLLEERIFKYFKYIGFNINNNLATLIITFVFILIISEIINYYLVRKKINNPISSILKED